MRSLCASGAARPTSSTAGSGATTSGSRTRASSSYASWRPSRCTNGGSRSGSGGAERHDRLFIWPDGRFLVRNEVQQVLCSAAVAEGADPDSVGSHSLRIGGASALWACYKDNALVRRWGRWSNDALHGYLWEARESSRGVSDSMAAADLTQV